VTYSQPLFSCGPPTEDERTNLAKNNTTNAKHKAIDSAHGMRNKPSIGLAQCGRNTSYSMSLAFNWTIKKLTNTKPHVSFASHNSVWLLNNHMVPIMITYYSGADGN
jgi:hypothetical protein